MKRPNTDIKVGLRRDRRSRGLAIRPDGREVLFNGTSGRKSEAPAESRKEVRAGKSGRIPKKKAISAVFVLCAAAALALGSVIAWDNCPAAIMINDEPVCYLKNTDEASKAMLLLAEDNAPEGTEIKAISVGDSMAIKKTPGIGYKYEDAGEAVKCVRDKYLHTGKAELVTASTAVYDEKYVPDPDIRKDDDMLAGQERVESEVVNGTQKVTKQYSVKNGEAVATDVINVDIVDPGSPAVIYRGTIGLPEGEDWRTYEGMPVYNDGSELIQDAQHYLGLRYIWGGFNLNKGVDCVGFVVEMYKKFGISLPHSHEGLRKVGISVPLSEARAGDIICYNGHVALYMGDGRIIHATRGKSNNVHISKSVNYNKKRHIITIRRVVGN